MLTIYQCSVICHVIVYVGGVLDMSGITVSDISDVNDLSTKISIASGATIKSSESGSDALKVVMPSDATKYKIESEAYAVEDSDAAAPTLGGVILRMFPDGVYQIVEGAIWSDHGEITDDYNVIAGVFTYETASASFNFTVKKDGNSVYEEVNALTGREWPKWMTYFGYNPNAETETENKGINSSGCGTWSTTTDCDACTPADDSASFPTGTFTVGSDEYTVALSTCTA